MQAKATCLVMVLPAKRREGQQMFGLLRFAWRCAIEIMECGNIIRTLPVEKKRLRARVSCSSRSERPTPFAADSGFAAEGTRREPAK